MQELHSTCSKCVRKATRTRDGSPLCFTCDLEASMGPAMWAEMQAEGRREQAWEARVS